LNYKELNKPIWAKSERKWSDITYEPFWELFNGVLRKVGVILFAFCCGGFAEMFTFCLHLVWYKFCNHSNGKSVEVSSTKAKTNALS